MAENAKERIIGRILPAEEAGARYRASIIGHILPVIAACTHCQREYIIKLRKKRINK
ncbi:MAG: hypothetical protein LUI87_01480 [Lachnospiraceae bacterium]|nr:hypothetical protein [Lachnospiraceae bacterium]